MRKTFKYKSELVGKEITFTISEELNKLKGKIPPSAKLQEANKLLRELKTPLPK